MNLHHVEIKPGISFDLGNSEEWWEHIGRLYEPEVVDVITRFVRAGDHCIDAGANHGYHTLLMSRLVGEKGSVIAFEPDPNHFQTLLDNLSRNQAYNVHAFEMGLWDRDGEEEFLVVEGGGYSSFCIRYENKPLLSRRVKTIALDNLASSFPALDHPIRLLKIDCEGAEQMILYGGTEMLTRGVDCVIAEFHFDIMASMHVDPEQVVAYMRSLGYDYFLLRRDGENTLPPLHVPEHWQITFTTAGVRVCNVMFAKHDRVKELWADTNA